MIRKVILIYILLTSIRVCAQGTRPNTLANLRLWIKADSLDPYADDYSNLSAVDSVFNWGSVGGAFVQATAANKPKYRTNQTSTGKPALDFDGGDFITHNSSTALYKFLHDGTANTTIFALRMQVTGAFQQLFLNNSSTSAQTGVMFQIWNDNKLLHYVTRGVGSSYVYNYFSTTAHGDTSRIQYFIVRVLTTPTPDTSYIQINGSNDGKSQNLNAYNTGNASQDAKFNSLNGLLFEVIMYADYKSDSDISNLLTYLDNKWGDSPGYIATVFLGRRRLMR